MKKILFACLVITLVISFSSATEGYDNLAKLVKSKVSEDIIIAFINSSNVNYILTADDIIHLTEMGASSKVITAAIQHKASAQTVSALPQVAAPAESPDNSIVYESMPPQADYWYNGYWQDPSDVIIYPTWQPYYHYHSNRGYNHGYSGGHGSVSRSTRTTSTTSSKSTATNKRSK
jgi:hypothetical protein